MAEIGICLATYQGGTFLRAQLESIAAQTFPDWHLYVRDDGSTDETLAILERFRARYPTKVTIDADNTVCLGASQNFALLADRVGETYLAFSDQDDIWCSDKLARAHEAMKSAEAAAGPFTPVMVHADRRVIDASGEERAGSYWASRNVHPHMFSPETHFTFCLAAGSTMLVNRSLRDLALPIPTAARMYDCWIELVAHMFGRVVALDAIALEHRRHGHNASGAHADIDSPAARRFVARARRLLRNSNRQRAIYSGYLEQAEVFRRRFSDHLSLDQQRRLDDLLSVPDRTLGGRFIALQRSRAGPPALVRKLAMATLSGRSRPAKGVLHHQEPLA